MNRTNPFETNKTIMQIRAVIQLWQQITYCLSPTLNCYYYNILLFIILQRAIGLDESFSLSKRLIAHWIMPLLFTVYWSLVIAHAWTSFCLNSNGFVGRWTAIPKLAFCLMFEMIKLNLMLIVSHFVECCSLLKWKDQTTEKSWIRSEC